MVQNATTVQQVLQLCRGLSPDDLRFINSAIVDTLKNQKRIAARSFSVGDEVSWTGRSGANSGKIISLGQINHVVRAKDGTRWKVTATLLRHTISA